MKSGSTARAFVSGLSVLDITPYLASIIAVIMPIVAENPLKFIQEKMKKWPSPE